MRVLLLLLVSAGVCFGQAFSFNDVPFMAQAYAAGNAELNVALTEFERGTLTSSGPTGLADGKQFTFSGWIYRYAQSNDARMVFSWMNASSVQSRWLCNLSTANRLEVSAYNAAGALIQYIATTNTIATNQWIHVFAVGDTATEANNKIYINGVLSTTNTISRTDDTIDFVGVNYQYHYSRWTSATANLWSGGLSELWWNDSYLDDPLAFITAPNGCPKRLGTDGSLPTGSSPVFYLRGSGTDFEINSGTGGNFTEINPPGTITPKQCNIP